jgi:DNA-binding CsgD family transcriptional regulator
VLTPRELEVLQWLGTGLSNAELAVRFALSEATVKTHVARILAKLQLRDRAQAVVVAYESGLITPAARRHPRGRRRRDGPVTSRCGPARRRARRVTPVRAPPASAVTGRRSSPPRTARCP